MKFIRVIPLAMVLMLAAFPSPALAQAAQAAQQGLTLDLTGGGQMTERLIQIIGLSSAEVKLHASRRTP